MSAKQEVRCAEHPAGGCGFDGRYHYKSGAELAELRPAGVIKYTTNRAGSPLALRQAQEIIKAVIATLDTTESTCGSCNVRHKANWEEATAAEELKNIIRKLEKHAVRLESGDAKGR